MNRKLLLALAVLVTTHPPLLSAANAVQPAGSVAAAQLIAQPEQNTGPSPAPAREIAWLGVSLGKVPDALFTQLGQVIPAGQGVLVEQVIPDSPAAKAGIHTNDVLLTYDDQKLFSARQLAGLIRADRPDRTVAIEAIQQGQLKTLNITLGKQDLAAAMPAYEPMRRHMPMMPHGHMPYWPPFAPPRLGDANQPSAWDQFESVEVHSLPDGRYHAAVSYKDEKNNTMQFSFEGTQQEIRDQIQKNATLPDDKKQALLQALNLKPETLFSMPMFEGNPFNDPFFRNAPFDDDFFRGFPPLRVPPGFPSYYQPSAPASGPGKGGGSLL